MITVYGMTACPGTMKALADLEERGLSFCFKNFAADTASLKEFLKIRDDRRFHEIFDSVRDRGGIGIPLFVKEDGTVTLDMEKL